MLIISLICLFFIFASSCFASDILINEFYTHTTDNDWIELYNTTDNPIDLTGWYLQDETSKMETLNEASFSAKSFLLVNVGNRLNNGGDTVKLFNSSSDLKDSWSYSQDPGDNICFGRSADGGAWHRLSPCTQGGSNNSSSIVDPSPSPSPSPTPASEASPSPSPSPETDPVSASPSPKTVVTTTRKVSPKPSPLPSPSPSPEEEQILGEDTSHRENKEEENKEEEKGKFQLSLPIVISGAGGLLLLAASFPFLKPKLLPLLEKIRSKRKIPARRPRIGLGPRNP